MSEKKNMNCKRISNQRGENIEDKFPLDPHIAYAYRTQNSSCSIDFSLVDQDFWFMQLCKLIIKHFNNCKKYTFQVGH